MFSKLNRLYVTSYTTALTDVWPPLYQSLNLSRSSYTHVAADDWTFLRCTRVRRLIKMSSKGWPDPSSGNTPTLYESLGAAASLATNAVADLLYASLATNAVADLLYASLAANAVEDLI